MATQPEVIKEFLVALGFSVDEKSLKRYGETLKQTATDVMKFSAVVAAEATAIIAGVTKIAQGMEEMYYASKRTGASVENIKAFGFAIGQMGGDAQSAIASLENLARNMRNSPGFEGMFSSITGKGARDAKGNMRDMTEMFGDLAEAFKGMEYYQANAYAQAMGIDEKTLMAMREGVGKFSEEYKKALKAAGLNSQDAAEKSKEFMNSLRGVMAQFELAATVVATKITPALTAIGKWMGDNAKLVTAVVTSFIALATTLTVVALAIKALALVGKLLAVAFSPVGLVVTAVLALGAAIYALYDDYKTWANGGDSLFDWGKFVEWIDKAEKYFTRFADSLKEKVIPVFEFLTKVWSKLLAGDIKGAVAAVGEGVKAVAEKVVEVAKPVAAEVKKAVVETAQAAKPALEAAGKVVVEAAKSVRNDVYTGIGNLIAAHESKGDYSAYNAGTKGVKGGKVRYSGRADLASMSINEILESSRSKNGNDKSRLFAVGKYQIVEETLRGAAKKMKLTGEEKFTPELQEQIFREVLLPKAAKDFISGKSNDKNRAMLALAKEWRSLPDPRTGKTFADKGASANKAFYSVDEVSSRLDALRNESISMGNTALSPTARGVGSQQVINNAPVIHVTGVQEPREVAREVGGALDYTNGQLAYNFRNSAR